MDETNFVAYPSTNAFAWNCFNQMVFAAGPKYSMKMLDIQP
jgi:hypothetical protein